MSQPIQKKIKVLHITSTPDGLGGVEKLLLQITENYDREHFELVFCNLFSKSDDEIFLKGLKEKGVVPYSFKGSSYLSALAFLPKLICLIKKEKIDIVHTWLFHAHFIGQIAARLSWRTGVLSRQYGEQFFQDKKITKQVIDMLSNRMATKIIACSLGIKNHVREAEKVAEEKIDVIHNSIDVSKMVSSQEKRETIIREFGLSGYQTIGVIANLYAYKGHSYLLKALSRLKTRYPEIKAIFVGEGPQREALQKEAKILGIDSTVIFAGYRQDIPDLIAVMDIVVQPSIQEGFGISLAEAMSMNKPIVASCVGGIPEVIGEYCAGFLVPPQNVDALTLKIEEILLNKNSAAQIGTKGHALVELKFGIKQMTAKYESLYKLLLQK
ncbi:MAG TPA: glycosyltransferase [Candidatus Omnitrophota bacterium]|nr:glycosyltransferase [Candidatus Omnitrophota bacterium]